MIAVAVYELGKLGRMLEHIQENSAAFKSILAFLHSTGIPTEAVDQFEVILINVIGERFDLQFCDGSERAFYDALFDVMQECIDAKDMECHANFVHLGYLVRRFLNNIS